MTLRNRNRWRLGLTVATAIALAIGATSCFVGLFAYYDDGAYRNRGFSLVQATFSANFADRSSRASLMSRMPAKGWRWETNTTIGRPRLNWAPLWASQSAPFPSWAVRVPLWMVLVLLGAPCAWMWWRHLSQPAHACRACGYDLHGLKGHVCPECGQTIGA